MSPIFLSPQSADDLLVASAECPSDDEDIDPCDPSSGESVGYKHTHHTAFPSSTLRFFSHRFVAHYNEYFIST